jgi:hypothetical protein
MSTEFVYRDGYYTFTFQNGGNKINDTIGINYEAGKIINHILKYPQCIGFENIQIAMDAPFHGRVATDDLRKEGRSEKFFQGYDESYLISQLENIFNHIIQKISTTTKLKHIFIKSILQSSIIISVGYMVLFSIFTFILPYFKYLIIK